MSIFLSGGSAWDAKKCRLKLGKNRLKSLLAVLCDSMVMRNTAPMKKRTPKTTTPADALAKPLLTTEAFAELLSIHVETVRRLIRENRIRATKVGPFWRVPHKEVERIIASGL